MDTASLIRIDLGQDCFHMHAQSALGRMALHRAREGLVRDRTGTIN